MGQSNPEDIACRVDISVCCMSATATGEQDAVAVLRSNMRALSARLGCVPGTHPDQRPASFFRFAGEDRGELRPARVEDGTVEAALGGDVDTGLFDGPGCRTTHVLDGEVFDDDHVVGGDKSARGLVVEVLALVGHLAVAVGDHLTSRSTIVGAALFPGEALLRLGESFGTFLPVTGILDQLPVARCGKGDNAHVGCRRRRR